MKKLTLLFLVLLVFCVAAPTSTYAQPPNGSVYDIVDYFTESEIAQINNAISENFGEKSVKIYIVVASDAFYQLFDFERDFNLNVRDDSIVLMLANNANNDYDLYTFGSATRKISDSEVDEILDHPAVYGNIKSGNYTAGVIAFIEQSAEAYKWSVVNSLVIGVILGSIGAAVTWFSVIGVYKMKTRSEKYPLSRFAKLELTHSNETFMGSFVTKRTISSSSSSSGGSRSSGGRSGGSRGGGHRGGR